MRLDKISGASPDFAIENSIPIALWYIELNSAFDVEDRTDKKIASHHVLCIDIPTRRILWKFDKERSHHRDACLMSLDSGGIEIRHERKLEVHEFFQDPVCFTSFIDDPRHLNKRINILS